MFRLNAVVQSLLRTYGLRKQQHQPVSHRFHRPGHHRQQAEESRRGALQVYRRQTPSQPSANMDRHETTSTAAGDMRLFLYETWKRWSVCVEPEDSAWFAQCPRTLCLRCPALPLSFVIRLSSVMSLKRSRPKATVGCFVWELSTFTACPALLCPVPWTLLQFSFVVRAAAANVNPRTRLSHMTEIPPLLRS